MKCRGCGERIEYGRSHPYRCTLLARAKDAAARAFDERLDVESRRLAANVHKYLKELADEQDSRPFTPTRQRA